MDRKRSGVSSSEIQNDPKLRRLDLSIGDIMRAVRGEGCRNNRIRLEAWWNFGELWVQLSPKEKAGKGKTQEIEIGRGKTRVREIQKKRRLKKGQKKGRIILYY